MGIGPVLRYIIKVSINILLYPLSLFPTKNNKVFMFNDLNGKDANYSSNPKYLSEYILKNHKDEFEIIYPLGKSSYENRDDLPKEIEYVKLFSLKYYYHALTSKFFVTTSGGISYLPFKKNQVTINTWHGGGAYKKMGLDATQDESLEKALKKTEKKTTYFVSSNKYFSDIVHSAFLIPKEKIVDFGMPRNDLFFEKDDKTELINKIKTRYNIPLENKVALYAPTYRSHDESIFAKQQIGPYDIDHKRVLESLEKRFGGKWTFVIRLHPSIAQASLDLPEGVINTSDYTDPQELFLLGDILINDYSSTMWDFSFTRKPVFIFATDMDKYDNFLGFYTSPYDWPFPLTTNNDELVDAIINFNEEDYNKELNNYYDWMENYENGTSSKQIVELMEGLKQHG